MANYRHTQKGTLIVGMLLASSVLMMAVAAFAEERTLAAIMIVATSLFIVASWLFSSLTVEVNDKELRWHFGPGFWKKRIERAQISKVLPLRTKWWYGWGIRATPYGWLYNVSGLDAVAVSQHSGKIVLIGTDEPEKLAAALATGPDP